MPIIIEQPKFQEEKLRELILYIAYKSADDPMFGATKLAKILFYSDFEAFGRIGVPITGARYRKVENGPVPIELVPVRNRMIEEKDLALQEAPRFIYTQKRPVALRKPNLAIFSAEEIALVDEVIEWLRRFGASEVSEISHFNRGWQAARDKEIIPYSTAFLSSQSYTVEDIERGLEFAKEHELTA